MALGSTSIPVGEYGMHFGRLDVDRAGFFDDTPPGPFDPYSAPTTFLREGIERKRRFFCKRQGGLFESGVKRIFNGEALPELGRQFEGKRRKNKEQQKTDLGVLKNPGYSKKHSTPGDWHGCIGKQPKAFSPELKDMLQEAGVEHLPPNFKTSPSSFGGPGYLNICLNPYIPMYGKYEPYELELEKEGKDNKSKAPHQRYVTICSPQKYFDPNPYKPVAPKASSKLTHYNPLLVVKPFYTVFPAAPLGSNSGCFSRFPRYISDSGKRMVKKSYVKPPNNMWKPAGCDIKSKFTTSVVNRVTQVSCNAMNFTEYRAQVYVK